ncbi:hypothetical protein [Sorangium sp. So ce1099]|uniref:hypothetical protein n=1 Tax=Sorangium sp. So ce1099 TaxID=3133331 RepID=UPI003F613DCD
MAAAQAFPFATEAAFEACTLRLARTDRVLFSPDTKRLSDELEAWLRPRAGGLSLDVLRSICDHAWFDGSPVDSPLVDALDRLARRHLEPCGAHLILRRDGQLAERLGHFRWLSLLLPVDLLVAARCTDPHLEPRSDRPSLMPPELARVLEEASAAEIHMHLGAALHFGLLWTDIMGSLARGAPDPSKLARAPGPPPFRTAGRFLGLLFAGAVARTQLAAFLLRRERSDYLASFDDYLGNRLPALCERLAWPFGDSAAEREIRRALGATVTGTLRTPVPRLAALYRHLVGPARALCRPPASRAALIASDPLAAWLPYAPGRALPETRFAHRALRYLRGPGRSDTSFARVFWQYQRIRGCTFRFVTQEPGTAGLDWFTEHYDRLRALKRDLGDGALIESALDLSAEGLRLGALEVRTAPPASWTQVRSLACALARASRYHPPGEERPEFGVLLHFIKERSSRHGRLERLHADPRHVAHGLRFGRWAYARLREALAIETALDRFPELLLVLRGLDLASNELAVPTWAALPALLHVRAASERAAARLAARRPSWRATPMNATCHAGEDYRRLVEGLRRLHEPLAFGLLRPGDRVGHAICLGHDPARWARCAAEIPQPAEERLDDLLWELDLYERGELPVNSSRYAFARAEALRIGRCIYGTDVQVESLLAARQLRHDPRVLRRLGYPFLRPNPAAGREEHELLLRYLTDAAVFKRGQRIELVQVTESEVTFLEVAQSWLRRELARLAITVESNPSSNILIGNFVSLEEHPSFRMQPLPGQGAGPCESVLLSLNSDDPLTFSTAPADEYAYVYGALLRSGVPASRALAWLSSRRDHGYRARFTLNASSDPDALLVLEPRPLLERFVDPARRLTRAARA